MGTVISVVSGKGGAGKSLLTAVLGRAVAREGLKVLLVDMDIFVRGLTVLLFGFTKSERRDGATTVSDLLGVFAEQSKDRGPRPSESKQYMIQRFFECDVLPAVDNISAPLDYDDRSLSDEKFCDDCVRKLLSSIDDDYDYILLDNRAGMDSLIAATCKNARIVLTVAEDDEVGRQTNVNLVRFLQSRRHTRVVYTILNKGRSIHTYGDVKNRARQRYEFSMLGVIPFDIDVLEEFGSERFWTSVMETLYFRALIDSWNSLARAESLKEISESKYHFPPSIFMQQTQGRYSLFERTLRIYGIAALITGAGTWLFGQYRYERWSLYEVATVAVILAGAVALTLSTSNFQSYLRGIGKGEENRRKRK